MLPPIREPPSNLISPRRTTVPVSRAVVPWVIHFLDDDRTGLAHHRVRHGARARRLLEGIDHAIRHALVFQSDHFVDSDRSAHAIGTDPRDNYVVAQPALRHRHHIGGGY